MIVVHYLRPQIVPPDAMTCPKCGARSGDDWGQCEMACPMAASPHYDALVERAFSDEI